MTINIDECTLQEACDYAVQMIVKQGHRCVSDGFCRYSDDQGSHCALGWLLKDIDDFDGIIKDFEGDILDLITESGANLPNFIIENRYILKHLQEFHDLHLKYEKLRALSYLKGYAVDTSKPWYQEWIDICHKDTNDV